MTKPLPEDAHQSERHAVVFNWFCDNGHAPPLNSEIDDLLMAIARTPSPSVERVLEAVRQSNDAFNKIRDLLHDDDVTPEEVMVTVNHAIDRNNKILAALEKMEGER